MRSTKYLSITILLVFALMLTACNILSPQATPTQDQQAMQSTLSALVTQKMQEIGLEQTATAMAVTSTFMALPTNTSTVTVEPTATVTSSPTVIPPTATRTRVVNTSTPAYTPTPNNFSCELASQSPANGTKFTAGGNFDVKWVVKNTGLKAWDLGYVDLVYDSGAKMQSFADVYDVSTVVNPGKTFTFLIDMQVPSAAGTYKATWKMRMENITMCSFQISIQVVNP